MNPLLLLSKLQIHLLRLFTPEFMHFNVKQQYAPDNFIESYFKALYNIEMAKLKMQGASNNQVSSE